MFLGVALELHLCCLVLHMCCMHMIIRCLPYFAGMWQREYHAIDAYVLML